MINGAHRPEIIMSYQRMKASNTSDDNNNNNNNNTKQKTSVDCDPNTTDESTNNINNSSSPKNSNTQKSTTATTNGTTNDTTTTIIQSSHPPTRRHNKYPTPSEPKTKWRTLLSSVSLSSSLLLLLHQYERHRQKLLTCPPNVYYQQTANTAMTRLCHHLLEERGMIRIVNRMVVEYSNVPSDQVYSSVHDQY